MQQYTEHLIRKHVFTGISAERMSLDILKRHISAPHRKRAKDAASSSRTPVGPAQMSGGVGKSEISGDSCDSKRCRLRGARAKEAPRDKKKEGSLSTCLV